MGLLSRAAILTAADLKSEEVEVPEWGGAVRVQELTAGRRQDLFSAMAGLSDAERSRLFRRTVLQASLVDETGACIFDESSIDMLLGKSAVVIDRVMAVALRLSGLGAEGEAAAKNA